MSLPTKDVPECSRPGPTCIRLLIVGDQPRVRQSLRALLTVGTLSTHNRIEICIEIVGEAGDGRQAMTLLDALVPDVVLLDLPTLNPASQVALSGSAPDGLVAIQTIKSRWPSVRIVVLTMYATERSAILLAGADAFLLKGCTTWELLDALTTVTR